MNEARPGATQTGTTGGNGSAYDFSFHNGKSFVKGVEALPKRNEIIEGVLPEGQVMLISGDPASGKSLEFQRLACLFGSGGSYHGLKCKKCRAAYITWEGAPESIADRFKVMLDDVKPEIEPIIKMLARPYPLNVQESNDLMWWLLADAKQRWPDLEVVMYDSFAYLVAGNIKKDEVINHWWTAMSELHRELGLTPIFVFAERKLLMDARRREDQFSLERLKGSYEIAYKANTVFMIGEEKGAQNVEGTTKWVSKGHRFAAVKVKDGKGSFERLSVTLNRDTLLFDGQEWAYNPRTRTFEAVGYDQNAESLSFSANS